MPNDNFPTIYYTDDKSGKKFPLYISKEKADILNKAADAAGLEGEIRKSFFITPFIESGLLVNKTINGKKVQVFNPRNDRVSTSGAKGAFQFVDNTVEHLGIKDPTDFNEAAFASAKYMRELYDTAIKRGEKDPATAASVYYNRGPNAGTYNTGTETDVPLKPETKQYIERKKLNKEAVTEYVSKTIGLDYTPVVEDAESDSQTVENAQHEKQNINIANVSNLHNSRLDKYISKGYSNTWNNPISEEIRDRELTGKNLYQNGGNLNNNDPIKYGTKEYRDAYNKGSITSYSPELDLHVAKDLPQANATAEAPFWLQKQRQFEKNNPKPVTPTEGPRKALGVKSAALIEWEKQRDDYIVKQIEKKRGLNGRDVEKLNKLPIMEQKYLANSPKYQTSYYRDFVEGVKAITPNLTPSSKIITQIEDIRNNPNLTELEKKDRLTKYLNTPYKALANDALGIIAPLTIPAKVVQSAYKDDYSIGDAIGGTKNDAGLVEDILTDPLTYTGAGLSSKLSKVNKLSKYSKPTKNVSKSAKNISKSNFKSEIDWVDWVKKNNPIYDADDIAAIKHHSKEYDEIEKATKADGTWMKNPDGSDFKATKEEFIQQKSEAFKKSIKNNLKDSSGEIMPLYHSNDALKTQFTFFDQKRSGEVGTTYGKGQYSTAFPYITKGYGKNTVSLYGDVGENVAVTTHTSGDPKYVNTFGFEKKPKLTTKIITEGSPVRKEFEDFAKPLIKEQEDYIKKFKDSNKTLDQFNDDVLKENIIKKYGNNDNSLNNLPIKQLRKKLNITPDDFYTEVDKVLQQEQLILDPNLSKNYFNDLSRKGREFYNKRRIENNLPNFNPLVYKIDSTEEAFKKIPKMAQEFANQKIFEAITPSAIQVDKRGQIATEVVIPYERPMKSRLGNNGNFDMSNPNFYKALTLPVLGASAGYMSQKNKNRLNKYQNGGDLSAQEQQQETNNNLKSAGMSLLQSGTGIVNNIQALRDNDKSNNAGAIGGLVGTAVDTAAMAFGIPTFGLGNKAGTLIGNQFADKSVQNLNSFYKQPNQFQDGGDMRKQAEIEKDEYVFNRKGLSRNSIKMLNNSGVEEVSDVGFLVKGDTHKNGGIDVLEGDAYIASNHLGVNGKRANKKNPSVAKTILKEGGKTLAEYNDADKFSVSDKYTPNAYKYLVKNMQNVADKAEHNKQIEDKIKLVNDSMKNQYKLGGYTRNISAVGNQQIIPQELRDAYMYRKNGGNLSSSPLTMTYDDGLLQYMQAGGQMGMQQDPMMAQQGMEQAMNEQPMQAQSQGSVLEQIPPEQQEQVVQMAQAAMQGDEQAMQQLVEMLGEEGVQMLMQELQAQGGGQQQAPNPSNEAAQQAMGQMPPMMMRGGKLSERYNRY